MDKLTVLIVDDEEMERALLGSVLRKIGCRNMHEGANAKDAMQKFLELQPDILFLDINMPTEDGLGKSGLDVLTAIKALDKNAFVVMVSGDSCVNNVKAAIGKGAKGFVVKPYKIEKVKQIVLKCAEKKNK